MLFAFLRSTLLETLHGRFAKGIYIDTGSHRFVVSASDAFVGRSLASNGSHAGSELQVLKALVSPESRVLILGAHIGSLGIPLACHVRSVVFVEANPETFDLLSANVSLNSVGNAVLHNVAVGDKQGEMEFLQNRLNSGGSKRKPKQVRWIYYYDRPDVVRVPMVTVDELLADDGADLVVMDLEGSEYFAL